MNDPTIRLRTLWRLYKLAGDVKRSIDHEIDEWDEAHGFGYDVPFDRDRYAQGHKCDEFQEIWRRYLDAKDAWFACLDEFCEEYERMTNGAIDRNTARTLATSPRYEKRLDAIMG